MNQEPTQDQLLRDVFRLFRRQARLIVAAVLVSVGAAIAYGILKEPVYEASSQVQFIDITQDLNALGTPVVSNVEQAKGVAADAEVITAPEVIRGVGRRVDPDLDEATLRDSVNAAVDPDTNLVTIDTTAADAQLAADLADGFARETRSVVTRSERSRLRSAADTLEGSAKDEDEGSLTRNLIEQRVSQLRSLATFARPVAIVSTADVPSAPSSPRPLRDGILAAFLGLILGILAAFLRDSLDRRLTDAHDVQHELGVPMLGYVEADDLGGVGFGSNGRKKKRRKPSEEGGERFRILRSNVDFLSPDEPPRTIAVTSPVAEEGKSTVAAGLAGASALAGKQVLLVECDLRRPVLSDRFGLPAQPGLTDWAVGKASPAEVRRQVEVRAEVEVELEGQDANGEAGPPSALNVIVAGTWAPRPAELLGSERFAEFLEQVSSVYDLVILDCPPLLPVGDTLELIPQVDAALICVRLDQTTHEQALAAKAAVEHFPARPLGIVVTGVKPGRDGYYYGYYSSARERQALTAGAARPGDLEG